MQKPTVTSKMSKAYDCKHSVRYNADDESSGLNMRTIYLGKDAYSVLGEPSKIVVDVKSSDS